MRKTKITVVTVCRNVEPMLRTTIESVKAQTYKDIEYIIVDGASTDGSRQLIAAEPCVSRWVSEPDRGIYDAMNKGVGMGTGDWVIFMNAGDTFHSPDTLAQVAAQIEPTDDVVYGAVVKADKDGKPMVKAALAMRNSHRMLFCHQSALARRELLLQIPFDIRHKYSADFLFFKTAYKQGKRFHRLDMPIADFDTSGVSNRRRSAGLADNISVILQSDGLLKGLPHLLHLLPTYIIARVRNK